MSKREVIEKRTEEMLAPILDELGFTLWDVEYVKEGGEFFLRAYIDKEGGINIDDCVDVSHRLSDALDEDDGIEDAYTLEVSSPGLGRKLVKDRELSLSIGREVDIGFYKPYEGNKEMTGILTAFDKDSITVEADHDKEKKQYMLKRNEIAVIRLSVRF